MNTEVNRDHSSLQPHATLQSQTYRIRDELIATLLVHQGAYVSGEILAQALQISRTAVWKHIRMLETIGFTIASLHRKGYRLEHCPDLLLQPLLQQVLSPNVTLGRHVYWSPSLDSTNTTAAQFSSVLPHGFIVSAWQQTAGKGRRGRPWFSPKGGLWFSVLLRHPLPLARAAQLTLIASVAMRRAILRQCEADVKIKWPNDLLLNGRKICGILAEIRADGEWVQHAVLGIGTNVHVDAASFPEKLGLVATSIESESGISLHRVQLTADFLCEFEPLYDALSRGEPAFAEVAEEWQDASSTLGRHVRVQTSQVLIEGLAERVDASGVLYVRSDDGTLHVIHSGDVLFDGM